MKSFKARNVFGLDSSISKQHRQHIPADAIARLINMSTRQSRVPSTWKFAKVTPSPPPEKIPPKNPKKPTMHHETSRTTSGKYIQGCI